MEKRKMGLLALVLPAFFLFLSAQEVFSLQEVAGPLVISVPVGGSNSASWGLLNDGPSTINVSLSSTGNAAQYLSFPHTEQLQPDIIDYIGIIAIIPNTSSAGNITGTLYALQEGNSGQVKINIQMMKDVTIIITGSGSSTTSTTTPSAVSFVNSGGAGVTIYPHTTTTTSTIPASPKATSTTTTTVPTTTTTIPVPTTTTTVPATSMITGFATFVSSPSGISVLFSLVGITAFTVFYKKWYVKRKMAKVVVNGNTRGFDIWHLQQRMSLKVTSGIL